MLKHAESPTPELKRRVRVAVDLEGHAASTEANGDVVVALSATTLESLLERARRPGAGGVAYVVVEPGSLAAALAA